MQYVETLSMCCTCRTYHPRDYMYARYIVSIVSSESILQMLFRQSLATVRVMHCTQCSSASMIFPHVHVHVRRKLMRSCAAGGVPIRIIRIFM